MTETASNVSKAKPKDDDIPRDLTEDEIEALAFDMDSPKKASIERKDGERIVVHFLADGFTAWGKVWYRGQTVVSTVGRRSYEDTCDRNGVSWLNMTEDEQIARWGEIKFAEGPWKGRDYQEAELKGKNAPVVDPESPRV